MTTLEAISFVLISTLGCGSCLLAARGLKRTKNAGFYFLVCVCAGVTANGIARVHEYGDSVFSSDRVLLAPPSKFRAFEAPVILTLLGVASLLLQKNEKKG